MLQSSAAASAQNALQMYKYNGVDTEADALAAFAREGYRGTEAQEVPKEISPLEIALKKLQTNSSMVSPSPVTAL